jgi:hypothetical protein
MNTADKYPNAYDRNFMLEKTTMTTNFLQILFPALANSAENPLAEEQTYRFTTRKNTPRK